MWRTQDCGYLRIHGPQVISNLYLDQGRRREAVANPETLKNGGGERGIVYQPRRHLSQMNT